MRYNKIYPYQGGGGVYSQPIITGLNVNASPIIQAASMPIDGGLEGYMGIQQLRQNRERMEMQREQMAMQQEEFKQRMLQQEKENVVSTMKMLSTLRDDLSGIEVLPVDAKAYAAIQERYNIQELAKMAGSGDTEAMKNYVTASSTMMGDPELNTLVRRKKESDTNLAAFEKIDPSLYGYIDNYEEVMESSQAGTGVTRARLNVDAIKADADAARQSALETAEILGRKREAEIRELDQATAEAEALEPYQVEMLESKIQTARAAARVSDANARQTNAELDVLDAALAGAKTPEDEIRIYREWNSKVTSASQKADYEGMYINSRMQKHGESFDEAYEALQIANKGKGDDVATMDYKDLSKYSGTGKSTPPIGPRGISLNPSEMRMHFVDVKEVPAGHIDYPGLFTGGIDVPSVGNKVIAYTQNGYLYTNHPQGLIDSKVTSLKTFEDDVEEYGEGMWRVPLAEGISPETSEVKTKEGVTLDGLTEDTRSFLGKVNSIPQLNGIVVTSAVRNAEVNKSVGGVSDSLHLTGDAFDIRTKVDQEGGKQGRMLAEFVETPEGKAWLAQNGYAAEWEFKGEKDEHLHVYKISSKAKDW